MSEDRPEDDPFHPSRWKGNWRSDPDGPISGDDYAYLKDLIHSRMGHETERFSAVTHTEALPVSVPLTLPPPSRWARFRNWLRPR